MVELKFLGNFLGFGFVLLGWLEVGKGWQQNIIFILATGFLVLKFFGALIDLLKKKINSTSTELQLERD